MKLLGETKSWHMMLKIKLFLIYKSVHAKILIITLAHVSLRLTAPSPEPTLPVHMDTDKGSNNGITVFNCMIG